MSPLRVEFHHPPEPAELPHSNLRPAVRLLRHHLPPAVASATWLGDRVVVDADDPTLKASIERAFRPVPVVVDDRSLRYPGTSGESVLHPGDLEWFRAVVQARVPAETGLVARFVPGVTEGGYDPAAGYRRSKSRSNGSRLAPRTSQRSRSRAIHALPSGQNGGSRSRCTAAPGWDRTRPRRSTATPRRRAP